MGRYKKIRTIAEEARGGENGISAQCGTTPGKINDIVSYMILPTNQNTINALQ